MDYSLQQRAELITADCMKSNSTNPYEIFHAVAQNDYVRIHGPEHHVLDGACILTAFHNAGGNIDLYDALQKLMCEGLKMPGAACGLWGVCGAVTSIGAALARLAQIGGPRCCKRDAFSSIEQAGEYIKNHYGITLDILPVKCDFSLQNSQCIGNRCPYNT